MYKDKFDKLVKRGVISESEKSRIYSQMKPNSDGQFIGVSDSVVDYKYYTEGDIFNEPLCDYVIKHCVPKLGMEFIDDTFKTYGSTYCGIGDGWFWYRKNKITQYAIEQGHKPIEEATREELWKMLAMSSMYWEGNYKEWYDRSEGKSGILDSFIGECEMKYFGYDDDGYTQKTIRRILNSISGILQEKFGKQKELRVEKNYKKIGIPCGTNLESAVNVLLKHKESGELVCCEFNDAMLYSDTVTMDDAYKAITGMTFLEHKEMLKKQHERIIKEEEEFQALLPSLIENWKQKARSILAEDKLDYWDRIVPIRASDLYRGMELDNCLDIVKILNNGGSFEDAKVLIDSQGHSGMSFSLVCAMIKEFCDRGEDFVKFVR